MSANEEKLPQEQEAINEEWARLDAEAEAEERRVIAELAGAQAVKARMDQRQERKEQERKQAEQKEADAAKRAEMRAKADDELSEGERVLRRAQNAARDTVQLRRTMRMAVVLAVLGLVDVGIGAYLGKELLAVLGIACAVACCVFMLATRPRYAAAKQDYDLRAAELVEYKALHPEEELGGTQAV